MVCLIVVEELWFIMHAVRNERAYTLSPRFGVFTFTLPGGTYQHFISVICFFYMIYKIRMMVYHYKICLFEDLFYYSL